MNLRDLISISLSNLWRMKLRAILTISGVVIAIAAFVAMVSFGAGNQKLVADQFNELGLFSTMIVYPNDSDEAIDSLETAVLDNNAITILSSVPGVDLAYPFDEFTVTVVSDDTTVTTSAQALPEAALNTRLFSRLLAGSSFAGDSVDEAFVTDELLEMLSIDEPDSIIGRQLIISVKKANIDSGLIYIFRDNDGEILRRLEDIELDSLWYADYFKRIARQELGFAAERFLDGFINVPNIVADTLKVCGVFKGGRSHRLKIEPVIIPTSTAARFNSGGISSDPADLFIQFKSNKFFTSNSETDKSYPQVTLSLDPFVAYEHVRDSVEALGYDTFSYAEQFKEIRRFFIYFNIALGVIGLVALATASLGIANTMVMSIIERTREIGVLKSLGAHEGYIRLLFLVESAVIGTLGSLMGILFGWLATRIASIVARIVMENQGWEVMELFALPWWLVLTAFLFGLVVSLAAGYYPASRAARIDPVEALRNE
ncbi:MAG: ABC transporter permease [candidate division Zixibacteria bacterium]|nr:ABC transporter permease [candidate division Zixibacteria bacterium]